MARSVAPRSKAPASEVTRPPSNAATSSRPPALPNAIPVALHCVGIGEHPPSGLNSFSQNKFYPFRDPDAPQSVRDAGLILLSPRSLTSIENTSLRCSHALLWEIFIYSSRYATYAHRPTLYLMRRLYR